MQNTDLPVSIIYIDQEMINQRIDNFVKNKYKNLPKDMIYRIIRTGRIRINKKRIKPNYKLKNGDILRIPPIKIFQKNKKIIFFKKETNLSNIILYEDNHLLIINKPPGIAVHGGSGISYGIIEYFRNIRPSNNFLELVHRLDRDTSGVLILAKKRSSLCILHKQLREKKIKKEYIALVHGIWPNNLKKISEPLLKIQMPNKQRKVFIHKKGKYSETCFQIIKTYSCSTLIKIFPKTGRTHQIRAHTLHAGYPIFFDKLYKKSIFNFQEKNIQDAGRLMLHAKKICFLHPKNGNKIYIEAPLDSKFNNYLKQLS